MHEDVFSEDIDVVGIMDIYHTSSATESSTQQSRNDFPCQACLAVCILYLFCAHSLNPCSISRHRLSTEARYVEGGVARSVNLCTKRCT